MAHATNHPDYLKSILTAAVYEVAKESPLEKAEYLSALTGNTVLLKREDLQPSFSFKIRGVHNKLAHLSPKQLERGVCASLTGNHANAVAFVAQRLGVAAKIVLPTSTDRARLRSLSHWGAEVILHGLSAEEAYKHALYVSETDNRTFIHPFDDPDIIAGNGTVAVELLRQLRSADVHAIFIPVGGGALAAGMSWYIKQIAPHVRVIGVQSLESRAMICSVCAQRRVVLPHVGSFADGVAAHSVGEETFRLAAQCIDDFAVVDNRAIAVAVKDIYEDTRSIVEPAGALAVAGIKQYLANGHSKQLCGEQLVAVVSGANAMFDQIRFVSELIRHGSLGKRWDVFLSHASEDKEAIGRPLADALAKAGLSVWFDESTLLVGDGLRSAIDKGLSESMYGVVILSPAFLNKSWPQRELDGLAALETDGRRVILPVWHDIDAAAVRSYSPPLADRLAAHASDGLERVVSDLLAAMGIQDSR